MHHGAHVRQGQVVAYSGNTGLATGPHLHYEIRIDNMQVNPLTVKMAEGRMLTGKELRDFLDQRLKMDAKIAAMPLETKVADISADLQAGQGDADPTLRAGSGRATALPMVRRLAQPSGHGTASASSVRDAPAGAASTSSSLRRRIPGR